MNILYTRVSSLEQKSDRQKVNEMDYNLVIEDKCSGSIPFAEREGGKNILKLLHKNEITSISVWQIDRMGRSLIDILTTIQLFSSKSICINFIQQGLKTLDENGKENAITNMIISILGVVGQMERNQIRERQLEGIQLAKAKGVYKGRLIGSKEDNLAFLTKHQKSVQLYKKGYKAVEISKINGVSLNTLTKIKKLAMI